VGPYSRATDPTTNHPISTDGSLPDGGDSAADAGPSAAAWLLAAAAICAWTVVWAWGQWSPSAIGWHFFAGGAESLLHSSHLHLYADDPELQIGPLTFLVTVPLTWLPAATARAVAQVAMVAVGPLLVLWLAPVVAPGRRLTRVLLAALVVVPAWAVLSVRWAHLDDVLAMAFTVAAIRAVLARRAVWGGIALGAAIASKPWAIGFLPLILVLDRGRRAALTATIGVTVAAWAPFLVADGATLRALRPTLPVAGDSGLHLFGYRGEVAPGWVRTAEMVAGPVLAFVAVLRRRWAGLFVLVFAARLVIDPQDLPYYVGSAVLAAVVFDLLATRHLVPWTALVTLVVLWQPFVDDPTTPISATQGWTHWWFTHEAVVGASHVVWALAVTAVVLLAPDRWLGHAVDRGSA
jgi:hypothetical protein